MRRNWTPQIDPTWCFFFLAIPRRMSENSYVPTNLRVNVGHAHGHFRPFLGCCFMSLEVLLGSLMGDFVTCPLDFGRAANTSSWLFSSFFGQVSKYVCLVILFGFGIWFSHVRLNRFANLLFDYVYGHMSHGGINTRTLWHPNFWIGEVTLWFFWEPYVLGSVFVCHNSTSFFTFSSQKVNYFQIYI